jgi:hypothetical protein
MKYICLGYLEPGKFENMSENERNTVSATTTNYARTDIWSPGRCSSDLRQTVTRRTKNSDFYCRLPTASGMSFCHRSRWSMRLK